MTDTERAEFESVIRSLMAEVERLQAVVAKLTEGTDDAHSVLRQTRSASRTERRKAFIEAAAGTIGPGRRGSRAPRNFGRASACPGESDVIATAVQRSAQSLPAPV